MNFSQDTTFNMKYNQEEVEIVLNTISEQGPLSLRGLFEKVKFFESRLELAGLIRKLLDDKKIVKLINDTYRLPNENDVAVTSCPEVEILKKKLRVPKKTMTASNKRRLVERFLNTPNGGQVAFEQVIEGNETIMNGFGLVTQGTCAMKRGTVVASVAYALYANRDRFIEHDDIPGLLEVPIIKYKEALNKLIAAGAVVQYQTSYKWSGKYVYPFRTRLDIDKTILKKPPTSTIECIEHFDVLVAKNVDQLDKYTLVELIAIERLTKDIITAAIARKS